MVTMKWWDDLWLNEGFGNTLMYFAIDHVYPQWKAVSYTLMYFAIDHVYPQWKAVSYTLMYFAIDHVYPQWKAVSCKIYI